MELPEIRLLQAAVVLSEVRNYTRAAKKLGIQQPTLTKRILELEKLIGFELFDRSTQFVEPTEACRRLVQEAKEVLFHAGRALQVAIAAEQGAQTPTRWKVAIHGPLSRLNDELGVVASLPESPAVADDYVLY
jgi:DNA-binding transcriptional LysR family regulator